jgi:hypothetical protein
MTGIRFRLPLGWAARGRGLRGGSWVVTWGGQHAGDITHKPGGPWTWTPKGGLPADFGTPEAAAAAAVKANHDPHAGCNHASLVTELAESFLAAAGWDARKAYVLAAIDPALAA